MSLASRKYSRRRRNIICSAQFVLLAATIFSLGRRETVKAATDPAQVAALHTIASSLASSNPFFHAWAGSDPCAAAAPPATAADPSSKGWPGVTCESDGSGNHVVTSLTLQGLGLSGQLPPALFELTTLRSLDTSLNPALTGSIYSTISALSDLSMLDMHGCNLSGSIPSTIGLLKKLNFFAVNSNQLSGSIPRQVANLTSLYFFDITDNRITGPVPVQPGFDTCTNIGHLHLSRNQLTYVPGQLGWLPNLIHLLVDNNRLNQTFPAGLSGSTSLQIIHLSNNTIQGRLSPSLNLPALQDLPLTPCTLSPCPLSLPLLLLPSLPLPMPPSQRFESQQLSSNLALNHLNGNLPPGLPSANLTRLHSIMLSDNNLTGPVPPLDALPAIATISLFDNHFTRAPAALLSNENVTLHSFLPPLHPPPSRLYGNDLCVPYLPAVTAACSPPLGIMQYQPAPICDDLSCPSLYAPSPLLLALTNAIRQRPLCALPPCSHRSLLASSRLHAVSAPSHLPRPLLPLLLSSLCPSPLPSPSLLQAIRQRPLLYGNDLCVPYRPAVTAACSPPLGFMQYQPPPICDDLSCPPLYAPSPPLLELTNACVCVSPLEVELKLTAPQYAVFNDDLASLLVERIAGSLGKNGIGISTGQVGWNLEAADGSVGRSPSFSFLRLVSSFCSLRPTPSQQIAIVSVTGSILSPSTIIRSLLPLSPRPLSLSPPPPFSPSPPIPPHLNRSP
ncbi:unnamed protein product [Closterium sp. Naga37s-1]|nr:unnamed protein product [Closterium sp. Naga37s-1]